MQANAISAMKYFQYRIIASHMFTWENLPDGLESEKLELMLIDRGSVAFFVTQVGNFILPFSSSGLMNVYGDLTDVRAVPYNGADLYAYQVDNVPRILYDNSARQPFNHYLRTFADRLAQIQKSILIAERQARMPSFGLINEDNKESVARIETKIDEGYPFIPVHESMDLANIFQVINTGYNSAVMRDLWEDYNKVEGEIYTMLGTMFNVEQNKAAGVNPSEMVINYSQTFAFSNARLQQRQRWCDKLNAEFSNFGGRPISCVRTENMQDIVEKMMQGLPSVEEPQNTAKEDGNADGSGNTRRLRTA